MAGKYETASCVLPISRIRTIMKSSPEVCNISQESLFLIAKATELFVEYLAETTLKEGNNADQVIYNDLAQLVDKEDILQFLLDIIPQKMKVKDAHAMMKTQILEDAL